VRELAKDYGVVIQTVHDIRSNRMKLVEIVRDHDGGTGTSTCNNIKNSSYEEVGVALYLVVQPEASRRNISL
jgi:hypothetical protein